MRVLLRAVTAAFLLAGPATAADIPVRDFARFAQYSNAKLSPNGDYVAVAMPIDDQTALAVVRIGEAKYSGDLLRFSREEHVADFWWVSENRVVTTIARRFGSLDFPHLTGELFGMDADGRNRDYLFGFRGATYGGRVISKDTYARAAAWMIDPTPREPSSALVRIQDFSSGRDAEYQAVHRIDVRTGKTQFVLRPPEPYLRSFLTDANGQVRYAAGSDDRFVPLAYSYEPTSKHWTRVRSPDRPDAVIWPLSYSDGESASYLWSNEGDGDHYCIVRHAIDSGERRPAFCKPGESVEGAFLTADGSRPYAAIVKTGIPELHIISPELPEARLVAALAKLLKGQALDQITTSLDGSKMMFRAYSDRNPGEYFLFERQTKKLKFLFAARPWIDPAQMAERRPIHFRTRDGRQVHGFLTLPKGVAPDTLPMVVNPHGGPIGISDQWGWDADAQLFASRGYAVLQVNFRGSGGYGERHELAGKQQWGTGMIDDITDGVRYVLSEKVADPRRICIYGGSFGGYAALMSAVREPDLYRCAIGYVGVYDLKHFKRLTDVNEFQRGKNYLKDWLGDTKEIERDQSPLTHIDKLKAAVMIVHGEEDKRVPFDQAKRLRSALEDRDYPYEWLVKAQEGHGFWKEEHRVELYEKMLAFLDKHIGKGAVPAATAAGK